MDNDGWNDIYVCNGVNRDVTNLDFMNFFADETLQFCLIFTLIFAFAVGISTSNFGSLVRYKIPCLPFYTAFLIILFYPPKQELVLRKKRDKDRKQTV